MNSFNRLSYTYRFIFNRKILFDNNRRCSKFYVLKKNAYIWQYRKKQLKLTIMEKQIKNPREKKYRITVILKNEVRKTNFNTKETAKFKMEQLRKLYSKEYLIGALEEKKEKWEVTWILV